MVEKEICQAVVGDRNCSEEAKQKCRKCKRDCCLGHVDPCAGCKQDEGDLESRKDRCKQLRSSMVWQIRTLRMSTARRTRAEIDEILTRIPEEHRAETYRHHPIEEIVVLILMWLLVVFTFFLVAEPFLKYENCCTFRTSAIGPFFTTTNICDGRSSHSKHCKKQAVHSCRLGTILLCSVAIFFLWTLLERFDKAWGDDNTSRRGEGRGGESANESVHRSPWRTQ